MQVPLICHPESSAGNVEGINVGITRGQPGKIELTYRVTAKLDTLNIASPKKPSRVNDLWKTTCFELFVGNHEDESYIEYNFAPSCQWAGYKFSGYRSDMAELATGVPHIKAEQQDDVFEISVMLELPDAWRERDLRAGVSAVIATKRGDISYWAVAHPPGKPDFHHRDCFALQLEARGTL